MSRGRVVYSHSLHVRARPIKSRKCCCSSPAHVRRSTAIPRHASECRSIKSASTAAAASQQQPLRKCFTLSHDASASTPTTSTCTLHSATPERRHPADAPALARHAHLPDRHGCPAHHHCSAHPHDDVRQRHVTGRVDDRAQTGGAHAEHGEDAGEATDRRLLRYVPNLLP